MIPGTRAPPDEPIGVLLRGPVLRVGNPLSLTIRQLVDQVIGCGQEWRVLSVNREARLEHAVDLIGGKPSASFESRPHVVRRAATHA